MQVIFLKLSASCKYVFFLYERLYSKGVGEGIALNYRCVTFFLGEECEGCGHVASW